MEKIKRERGKPRLETELQNRRNVTISDRLADKAIEIGGNLSSGVRVAIEAYDGDRTPIEKFEEAHFYILNLMAVIGDIGYEEDPTDDPVKKNRIEDLVHAELLKRDGYAGRNKLTITELGLKLCDQDFNKPATEGENLCSGA